MQNHADKKPSTPTTDRQSSHEKSPTGEIGSFAFNSPVGAKLLQRAVQAPGGHTLTPAIVQRLQQQFGNRFVTQLMQRAVAPTPPLHNREREESEGVVSDLQPPATPLESPIQRRYKYAGQITTPPPTSTQADIWQDAGNQPFTLASSAPGTGGIVLTFNPFGRMAPPETFTVPDQIGSKKFFDVVSDAVRYSDPNPPNHTLRLQDLTQITEYKVANAKSSFAEIGADKFDSHFHRTSFLGRVSLVPIQSTQGNELFKANELWVEDVKIADERPPTKFGDEGQRSHTVAWTLLRSALNGLAGQSLNTFFTIVKEMLHDTDLPTNSSDATKAAQALYTKLQTGIAAIGDANKASEIFFWQRLASDLLGNYVHYYQLSESATYADAQAVGHGEPTHMAVLRGAESVLKVTPSLKSSVLEEVKQSAVGLLDYKQRLSDKNIAQIFHHWINNLYLAFPLLMRTYHADIVNALNLSANDLLLLTKALGKNPTAPLTSIVNKPITISVTSGREMDTTALPRVNQSTFVANVYVVPQKSVIKGNLEVEKKDKGLSEAKNNVALGHYKATEVKIEQVEVADDRPNTRFGNLQRSHTVAWTLVRRHLINFSGKSAIELLNFIANELPILQGDIDSPESNKKITFDASGAAADINNHVMQIAGNADGFPLHQWQTRLSELIESYVTLYQLSRSATYSKEERPKGHGESNAIGSLDKIEADLIAIHDKHKPNSMPEKKNYTDANEGDICEVAIKLVDAAVATSSLQPKNWQIAIEHWLKLLEGKYPTLMGVPSAAKAIRESVTVAEPSEELLAGYKPGLKPRDKLLINLYEGAKYEARSAPQYFANDLRSSMRLWLAQLPAPKSSHWSAIVNGIRLDINKLKPYAAHLQEYFSRGSARRGGLKDPPAEKAIGKVIEDVKGYFDAVNTDKNVIVNLLLDYIVTQAEKDNDVKKFVSNNGPAIQEKLVAAFDEAIELSIANTMDNYQAWYIIVYQIKASEEVNYETLMRVIEEQKKKKK